MREIRVWRMLLGLAVMLALGNLAWDLHRDHLARVSQARVAAGARGWGGPPAPEVEDLMVKGETGPGYGEWSGELNAGGGAERGPYVTFRPGWPGEPTSTCPVGTWDATVGACVWEVDCHGLTMPLDVRFKRDGVAWQEVFVPAGGGR